MPSNLVSAWRRLVAAGPGRALAVSLALVLLVLAFGPAGCKYKEPPKFTESVWFVGGEVDAATLNRGREAYMLYCYACHGADGDGHGPAAYALRPPPRDFRVATFKFAGVAEGLPHDEDLRRIVVNGLDGTAMLPWDIPEPTLDDIMQYIKWFSPEGEGFRDPDGELGERITADPEADPWGAARQDEAVERGKKIYHGSANCWSCHSSYVTTAEISKFSEELKGKGVSSFRPALFQPEIKETGYMIPPKSNCRATCMHKVCGEDDGCGGTCTQCPQGGQCTSDGECKATQAWESDCSQECEGDLEVCDSEGACVCIPECDGLSCGDDGCGGTCGDCNEGSECIYGTCRIKVKALPPDFLFNEVRAGTSVAELYRVIAAGIPGTAMPAWKGALPEEDVWAMAYYVHSLIALKGTPQARTLRSYLDNSGGGE